MIDYTPDRSCASTPSLSLSCVSELSSLIRERDLVTGCARNFVVSMIHNIKYFPGAVGARFVQPSCADVVACHSLLFSFFFSEEGASYIWSEKALTICQSPHVPSNFYSVGRKALVIFLSQLAACLWHAELSAVLFFVEDDVLGNEILRQPAAFSRATGS